MRAEHPGWHAAPVPAVGPDDAHLLVVGLAPGMRGANRTGRPFLGDDSGALLYPALARAGFATERGAGRWRLLDTRITNAVRCVPPANRPLPEERRRCAPFLERDLGRLLRGGRRRRPVAVLALGAVAHEAVLRLLGRRRRDFPFAHGAEHRIADGARLVDAYHPSRYNVRTGRLTEAMFDAAVATARRALR